MKILFFSTNSNFFDTNIFRLQLPVHQFFWERLVEKFPDDEFIVATQSPGMFLLDISGGKPINRNIYCGTIEKVRFEIIEPDDEDEIADFIASFAPDVAVAATFYVNPFDWLSIKDSIVAEKLSGKGVKVICNPLETTVNCFDKWRTHQTLEKFGFSVAKAVYVHHELFINGGNRREIKSNVYKSSVLEQISHLHFPVVVKDTVGLSSYGMDVLETAAQVRDFLKSKRFTSDRIIEEYIEGFQFGTEIYGADGNYAIMPPFIFSVNKYGITSPKQSVKIGPVLDGNFSVKELESELLRMSKCLNLSGVAQVDLVFCKDERKWYIIEINPRLSGMTETYSVLRGMSVYETLSWLAHGVMKKSVPEKKLVMNIKLPLLDSMTFSRLKSIPFVQFVHQVENKAAKQIREKGYCEVVFTGSSKEELSDNLEFLSENFSSDMEESFVENAKKLLFFV